MPGARSAGFTKSAQKSKFIRHRDVKLKQGEVKKEENICRAMCEGVCKRCREKVQWKFKYDKYKPLKNPGNCQQCKQKVITKAYRTLCDGCASSRNACSSCCRDMDEANQEDITKESNNVENKADEEMELEEMEGHPELVDGEANIIDESAAVDEVLENELKEFDAVTNMKLNEAAWNERKFTNMAANKYSKNRSVGKEEF